MFFTCFLTGFTVLLSKKRKKEKLSKCTLSVFSNLLVFVLFKVVIVLDDSDSEVGVGSPFTGHSLNRNSHPNDKFNLKSDQIHSQDSCDVSTYNKEFEQRMFDLNTSVSLVKKTSESLLNVLKDANKLNFSHTVSNYSINSDSSSISELKNQDHVSLNSHHSGDPRAPSHSNCSMTEVMHKFKEKNKAFYVSAQACVNVSFRFHYLLILFFTKY